MIIDNIKNNFRSGLTVALVSIPLSVSLAVASGVPPFIGIITAIWAGLIAAVLGGSNFNIIGPTGALSGIIATYVIVNGINGLASLTIVVGLIILLAYFLKFEKYLILIPSSVIHGFTLGVAFIIGLGQLNFALGLRNLPKHESFFANLMESLYHLENISLVTIGIFLIFLVFIFLFKKYTPKLPGVIVLVPFGILLGYLSEFNFISLPIETLGDKFGEISFQFFNFYAWEFSGYMLKTAAVIALVAILETLLSAKVADTMTHTKHNQRQEMFGLGFANIISGLFGGMPATAALARTSLNIKTGARHWTSGVINAFGVILISLVFLGYFNYIPMSVIAAILVYVAIQMVEVKHYLKYWYNERQSFFVALIVAVITVTEDPMMGILLGVAISLLLFVNKLSHGYFDARFSKFKEGMICTCAGDKIKEIEENVDVLLYSVGGHLCYLNCKAHIERFEINLKKYKYIILRLKEVHFMDTDGIEALDEIINIIEARGQQALITGIDPVVLELLEKTSVKYPELKKKKLVFKKSEHALKFLGVPTREKQQEKLKIAESAC